MELSVHFCVNLFTMFLIDSTIFILQFNYVIHGIVLFASVTVQ